MADDAKAYLEKLKPWALFVAATLVLSIASALAQRWLGAPMNLPSPPPVIVIQPTAEGKIDVQVISPSAPK
jgi:hypothetical protein